MIIPLNSDYLQWRYPEWYTFTKQKQRSLVDEMFAAIDQELAALPPSADPNTIPMAVESQGLLRISRVDKTD